MELSAELGINKALCYDVQQNDYSRQIYPEGPRSRGSFLMLVTIQPLPKIRPYLATRRAISV